jgi:outer membrane PBP1 activator LpoA protein
MPARLTIRLILIAAAALGLSACPSLSERAGLPPSVDRAEALERAGDRAGAAQIYEQLAGPIGGSERNGLLLRAVRDYLAAGRAEEAARVLGLVSGALSPEQLADRTLSEAEMKLERGQAREALQQLQAIPEPPSAPLATRYQELRARALLAAGRSAAGAGEAEEAGPHIALLLPVTGRAAGAAISVREGFMTAYYQVPQGARPRVRIYDTGTQSVADALTQAMQLGALFIVGPLTREEVTAAARYPALRVPVLALNFLPAEQPVPPHFYQYALSPQDEARLAARRILEDHHRRGVAITAAGEWGERVLAAFRQELESGGGELIASAAIDASRTDYTGPITEVLRLADSTARWRRLEGALGTRLQFEPRRRGDIEFIFAAAQAGTARLLRPQLRFHYAGDIPTYATSDAFEPDVRANEDLDGLMFPDMPWMLGGDLADAVHAATREAWPAGGPQRSRLFAFGFDAFRLAQTLRAPGGAAFALDGLTGRLTLDAERRVRREIGWARLHNGELRMLPAATP